MAVHESGVNYRNLIRDLAEMYPFEVSEVVVVELVANALDAKATRISIDLDQTNNVLTIVDNGDGMTRSQFDQYHDFAVGLKTRGSGIGFAGVGAKISFNVADKVVTETRSKQFSGGSNWYLESKNRLLWEEIAPSRLSQNGTRVEVHFSSDARLSYSTTEDLIHLLKRHYLPLFEHSFLQLYDQLNVYSSDFRFVVNGQVVEPINLTTSLSLDKSREFFPASAGKRIGYGIFGLTPSEYQLGDDVCGVLLCTRGKVIKVDLFNQFPGPFGPRLLGVVEIPRFVEFLTTSKTDFIRGRGKYRQFERLYNPIRTEFKAWLAELGIQPIESGRGDEAAKLERELGKILADIPELTDFLGFRHRKQVLQQNDQGTTDATLEEGQELTFPIGEGTGGDNPGPVDVGNQPGEALIEDQETGTIRAKPITRRARRGPRVTFVSAPDRIDLGWVDGNSVVINSGHPAYDRAQSNATSRTLHSLFAIASSVQNFMAETEGTEALGFIDRMMAAWGRA